MIPIWQRQAKEDRMITVTDPDMTRFWMGESDAVALIQQAAGALSGTITVPKMRSLSLREMAHIVAPGAELHTIGLRSVEKRHEDLLHTDESATDEGDVFIIGHPEGKAGRSYTSYDAPRLASAEFRRMLAEAEAHE